MPKRIPGKKRLPHHPKKIATQPVKPLIKQSCPTAGSEQVKSFSAGSLLMYGAVDKLLDISGLLRSSGLKAKGVDLADIVKTLTCGVLDGKRSVRAIDLDVKGSGKADYVNSKLGVVDKRVLYRAVEALGSTGDCLYKTVTQRFQEKTSVKIVQANHDYSSSYFEGITVSLAKHGYSRDHRPDKKQVKLGLVQVNDEKFARTYFLDSGEKTDLTQFAKDFPKARKDLPKGTLVVIDRGISVPKNLALIAEEHRYLAGLKKGKEIKAKIQALKQDMSKLAVLKNGYQVFTEKNGANQKFYFYSEQLFYQHQAKRKKKFQQQYDNALKAKNKNKKKVTKNGLEKTIVYTQVNIQNRLLSKKRDELEQDYLSHDGCYDGWFVLETNDEKMTAEQALKHYKDKDAVEKLICTLKQDCKLRPFNVRKDACVKGSLFISMLASLIVGVFYFTQKSHLGKMSTRSIVEKMKTLTLDLIYNTAGQIIEQVFKNVTALFAKIFPQLQT